jgi:hypothetical protein
MISYSSSVSATYGFISKSILVNRQSMDMFSVLPQTRRYTNGFFGPFTAYQGMQDLKSERINNYGSP